MASRSEDPRLIIRVINFELVQPICPRYVNVTDGRTDGRPTIAIPRFALHASRGNKPMMMMIIIIVVVIIFIIIIVIIILMNDEPYAVYVCNLAELLIGAHHCLLWLGCRLGR